MKKLILIFALFCFGALSANAQSNCCNNLIFVEVTGSSTIKVVPDVAYVSIIINENDAATKSIGIEKAEKKMFAALKLVGLDVEKVLSLNDISSGFVRRKNVAITKNYTLKLTNLKQLNDVYSKLENAGISNVEIDRFEVSNIAELRLKAKAQAVANAKTKANVLVDAAGRQLGNILYIADYDRDAAPVMRMTKGVRNNFGEELDGYVSAPNIDIREMEVVSNITTRWAIIAPEK